MRGFQIEKLGFLLHARRVNIGLADSFSVALTPMKSSDAVIVIGYQTFNGLMYYFTGSKIFSKK
jgi:hypothetical protein